MASIEPVRIQHPNPPLEDYPRTFLKTPVDAAATAALPVISTDGLLKQDHNAADFVVILGDYGEKKAEIKKVTADDTQGQSLGTAIAALTYGHEAGTPVTFSEWDQVKFYGRTASGGTNVLLATLSLDCSRQFTEWVDISGLYTHYVMRYYNSVTGNEGPESQEIASTSYGRNTAKHIIKAGLRLAQAEIDESPGSNLTWDIALEVLSDGIEEIIERKKNWPFLHTIDTSISTVAEQAYIDVPSDLSLIDSITVNNYKLDPISKNKYRKNYYIGSEAASGTPVNLTIRNNVPYLLPTPNSVLDVVFEYWKYPSVTYLSSAVDKAFSPMLKAFCASVFSDIRGNLDRASYYNKKFRQKLEDQVIAFSGPEQWGDAEEVEEEIWDDDYELVI
jgi:hypothetical protein